MHWLFLPCNAGSFGTPGPIPSNWFSAYPQLTHLRLVGCGVQGTLPSELLLARRLQTLTLPRNQLTGQPPEELVEALQVTE